MGLALVYGFSVAARLALSSTRMPAPGWSAVVEDRERFERRTNKSFTDKVADNRGDVFSRGRLGLSYSDGNRFNGSVVYEYTHDLSWTHNLNSSLDNSDLLLAYFSAPTNVGVLTAGRQRLSIGNQRVLGESDWKVASNSWDAVRLSMKEGELFAGRLAVSTYDSKFARVVGADCDSSAGKSLLILAHDRLGTSSADVFTFDQIYSTSQRGVSLEAELAGQFGKIGSESNRAFAVDLKLKRRYGARLGGYFEGGLFSGGKSGANSMQFSVPYGSKHMFTGYADIQGCENLRMLAAGLSYQLHPASTLELVYYKFDLFDCRDAWYSKSFFPNKSGSITFIDPTGRKGGDVGQEIDLVGKWAYSKSTEFSVGASTLLPGDFIKAFVASNAIRDQLWFYTQVSYKFAG